ncbi:DUF4411 family protein [Virgibacillus natechei]
MNTNSKFLLDANVFIEAYQRYYAFDIAPSFWRILNQLAEDGKVISIDRIKQELMKGDEEDPLCLWARSEFESWFMSTDDSRVFVSYTEIINWVQGQAQFHDYAKSEFASVADSWLIAYAYTYNHTIVTHERHNRDIKKRVLIPNVCRAFNIPYLNTFVMLRKLNSRM